MTGLFMPAAGPHVRQFTAPATPHGSPRAVRETATALRGLAGVVRSAQGQTATAFAGLGAGWQGEGQRATAHPLDVVAADTQRVATGLDDVAGVLDRYAAELDRAQHAHKFSWGKLLKVGAVVVVSAGVIVVTVGAAAPEVAAADSLLIGGEVTAMATAAGTATAAASSTAAELVAAARVLTGLRGRAAAVRPALPIAAGFTGLDAVQQELTAGRLDLARLATEFGINLMLPPAIGKAGAVVRGAAALTERPVAAAAASHLAAGGVSAAAEAAREQLENGHISPADVAVSAGIGAGLSAAGSAAGRIRKTPAGAQSEAASSARAATSAATPAETSAQAAQAPAKVDALVGGGPAAAPSPSGGSGGGGTSAPAGPGAPNKGSADASSAAVALQPSHQTALVALADPLDLVSHEGPDLGHTIARHVGKTLAYLQARLDAKGSGKVKSTFYDLAKANQAVQRTLRGNAAAVRSYAADATLTGTLELRSPALLGEGWLLTRQGVTAPTTIVTVLAKRAGHTYVRTSYLE